VPKVSFTSRGSFDHMERFLHKMQRLDVRSTLEPLAQQGLQALRDATPRDSGVAASSWDYNINMSGGKTTISWINSDVENGFPVAIMLQYGHGTGTGGYVAGRDYINPALKPVFDQIANEVWKVVTSA
jgi:hypothetical protein